MLEKPERLLKLRRELGAPQPAQAHTPGKWGFNHGEIGSDYIAILQSTNSEDDLHICNVRYQKDQSQEANARLIAAAPKLLEALKEALKLLNTYYVDASSPEGPIIDKARAAIASATEGR